MKKGYFTNKLISAIAITLILLYFMVKTTSPKIIFIPFLVCSICMTGKYLAILLDNSKLAVLCSKLFIVGFLLFWFGFLIVAEYICIRDKDYGMMLFTLPFWLVGIYIVKNKLLYRKDKEDHSSKLSFSLPFGLVISTAMVLIALCAGVMLFVQGLMKSDMGLLFAGGFFAFGSFTFVLAALTLKGCFDKLKIDVFGMYVGIFFVVIGIGIVGMIYKQAFGFWILIPLLLIVAGVVQIVKCLKRK